MSDCGAVPKKEAFAIGGAVEVVVNNPEKDVEDYYYLKSCEGSKGQIVKVLSGRQYEVLFPKDNRIASISSEMFEESRMSRTRTCCCCRLIWRLMLWIWRCLCGLRMS